MFWTCHVLPVPCACIASISIAIESPLYSWCTLRFAIQTSFPCSGVGAVPQLGRYREKNLDELSRTGGLKAVTQPLSSCFSNVFRVSCAGALTLQKSSVLERPCRQSFMLRKERPQACTNKATCSKTAVPRIHERQRGQFVLTPAATKPAARNASKHEDCCHDRLIAASCLSIGCRSMCNVLDENRCQYDCDQACT